jgi:tetratricopeptide (TPR) repeat protein
MLIVVVILPPPMRAQQQPLTETQVQSLVHSGLGDETGAKAIEQRGIDFAPAEDFLQSLKAAGASEAFLKALRAAKPPEPASAKKPINQVQVITLLAGGVPSHRVAMLVKERGIDFEPQDDYLQEVRLGGGDDELITALKSAKVTKPATVDPTAQARQAEMRHHMVRAAELDRQGQYAKAETEVRAALLLDSQDADLNSTLYTSLAYLLGQQEKWDDDVSAAREALRLNPDNDMAHNNLSFALTKKGDWDGAITEAREALRLNPNNDVAHHSLGFALGKKGDWDGEITEEREALRLNPNLEEAHINLGAALGKKGDWDGAIGQEREALRLDPKNELAHVTLGADLFFKKDWDGMIQEEREALRLNPNNATAHSVLGVALERKHNPQEALQEYRKAYELNPQNPDYRKDYERLVKKTNH